jgi:hypothetical protein
MRTVIMVALGLVISAPSIAQTHVCQPAIDAQLQKEGIALNRVASTDVKRDHAANESTGFLGYTVWMRMKSCNKGYLLMSLHTDCTVMGPSATSGHCKIAGIPHC